MVVHRHGHYSHHFVYVLSGGLTCGDRWCPAGTHIDLPMGAALGPLTAGPEGVELIEDVQGLTHTRITLSGRVLIAATVRPGRVLFASTEAMRLLGLRGGRYELLDEPHTNTSPTPGMSAFIRSV